MRKLAAFVGLAIAALLILAGPGIDTQGQGHTEILVRLRNTTMALQSRPADADGALAPHSQPSRYGWDLGPPQLLLPARQTLTMTFSA
jgi:hypothetical protein